MLLYKNGRIYTIQRIFGETRHEHIERCWFMVNGCASEGESIAWSARQSKQCSYGAHDIILSEKQKNLTK